MTAKASEMAQRVQDEQGFIVVWSSKPRKQNEVITDILRGEPVMGGDIDCPVCVVGTATHEESVEQAMKYFGFKREELWQVAPYYYKVRAE